jgi:hypothetical protein
MSVSSQSIGREWVGYHFCSAITPTHPWLRIIRRFVNYFILVLRQGALSRAVQAEERALLDITERADNAVLCLY